MPSAFRPTGRLADCPFHSLAVWPFCVFVFSLPFFIVIRYCIPVVSRGLSFPLSLSKRFVQCRQEQAGKIAPDPKQNIRERRCDHQTRETTRPPDTSRRREASRTLLHSASGHCASCGPGHAGRANDSERQRNRATGERERVQTRRRARLGAQEALIHTCHWLRGSRESEENRQAKRKGGLCCHCPVFPLQPPNGKVLMASVARAARVVYQIIEYGLDGWAGTAE